MRFLLFTYGTWNLLQLFFMIGISEHFPCSFNVSFYFSGDFYKKLYCLKYYSPNRIPMREDFPTTLKSMILLTWMWTRARWRFKSNTYTGIQIFLRGSGSALKESKRQHHWRNCHPFLFFLRSVMSWRPFLTFFVAWNIIINNVHTILQIDDKTNIFGMSSEGNVLRKNLFFGFNEAQFQQTIVTVQEIFRISGAD